jgi:hypothetical protein
MADAGRIKGTQEEADRKDQETGSPADALMDSVAGEEAPDRGMGEDLVADRGADEDLATYDRGRVAGPDLPDADSSAVIGGVADEEMRPSD